MINFISLIGPLQVALHVVQNRRAREQTSHRYKTRDKHNFKWYFSLLVWSQCDFLASTAVLYHVNG